MFLLLSLGAPPALLAQAAPRVVCVTLTLDSPGIAEADLRAALAVEGRKRGLSLRVLFVAELAECPGPAPRISVSLAPGPVLAVFTEGAPPRLLDLSVVDRLGWTSEAARFVLAEEPGPGAPSFEPLVDLDAPVWVSPPPPPLPGTALPVGGLITVYGGYAFELGPGSHRGELGGEVAIALLDSRLSLGLSGLWSPSHERRAGRFELASWRADLLAFVRAGLWLGPVLLRVGLGGGWQWRSVTARVAERFAPLRAESGAGVVGLEVEALFPLGAHTVLGFALPGRLYLGGLNHVWNGERFFVAPRGAVGFRAVLGVSF